MIDLGKDVSDWRLFRVDVRYLRKGELFSKSAQFLLAGGVAMALYAAVVVWVLPFGITNGNWLIAVPLLALLVLAGMGLLGGLYLLVRACFRSRRYDPHQVWAADEPRSRRHGNKGDDV